MGSGCLGLKFDGLGLEIPFENRFVLRGNIDEEVIPRITKSRVQFACYSGG